MTASVLGGPGGVDAPPDPANNLVRGVDVTKTTRFERFMDKVQVLESGCWRWTAARDRTGYGRFAVDGTSQAAHRYGYSVIVGPIPVGLDLDHLCRNRWCVCPDHLEPVTRAENLARRPMARIPGAPWRRPPRVGRPKLTEAERKTHCPHGHPYDEENTQMKATRSGGLRRACKACERANRKRRRMERAS